MKENNVSAHSVPEVSVIIPAYNVENYIEECILSILNASPDCIEIIAVNDGSTDNTLDVLEKLRNKYENVKVINQSNKGVTGARIAGIKEATGKYIGFVDGDDYIKSGMYKYLYDIAEEKNVDVVLNQQFYKKNNDDISVQGGGLTEGLYTTEDKSIEYLYRNLWNYKTGLGILPDLWCNLYKREYAKAIMCSMPYEVSFGEDEMFIFSLVATVDSIYLVNCPYYVYRMREGSVCNSINEYFLKDINIKYLYLKSIFEKMNLSAEMQKQLDYKTVHEVCSFRFLQNGGMEFHMFPFEKIRPESNVILYGAGLVGRSYYRQISANNYCNIIAWCDERYIELKKKNSIISSPDIIKDINSYDYILIAVVDFTMGIEIKNKLLEKYGLDEKKIITHVPLSLSNFIVI